MARQTNDRERVTREAERARRLCDGLNDRQSIAALQAYADELERRGRRGEDPFAY